MTPRYTVLTSSLRLTRAELSAAQEAVHRMQDAEGLSEVRQAWQDFLNRLGKDLDKGRTGMSARAQQVSTLARLIQADDT